jgi:hypothetical protein
MGLNPFRAQRKTAVDIAMVIGTVTIALVLVLWAVLSG